MAGVFDDVPEAVPTTPTSGATTPVAATPTPGLLTRFIDSLSKAQAEGDLGSFGDDAAPEAGYPMMSPGFSLPRTGEPGTIQRGVSEVVGGLAEGMMSPGGILMAAGSLLPGGAPVIGGVLAGLAAKSAGNKLGEASVTGDRQMATEGVMEGLLAPVPALGAMAPRSAAVPVSLPTPPTTSTPFLTPFLPHAEAKTTFSQPFGAGRVPLLGRIVDPQSRMTSGPLHEALAAYNAERYGVAPAAASNVGLQLRARGVDEAFPVDATTGEFTTVQPTRPGQSLHPRDVMTELQRDPASYDLTAPQRTAFTELERWRAELDTLESEQGIKPGDIAALSEEGDAGYFPRIVIKRPETDVAPLGGGNRVGAKQGFQKSPLFESEREGVSRGYRYEPSLVARATTRTERSYRAMADRRLAEDPTLGARGRPQVESELRETYAEELGAGTMTEKRLQQIVDSVEHKGTVWGQPGFAGKIFDPETANTLSRAFPQADSTFRHRFAEVNNALKAMRLSADVGVSFLQGQATLYRNPASWGKATYNSFRALVDSSVLSRYAQANAEAVLQLAQHGSSVGRLPEMLAGLEKGSFVERLPVVGAVFRAAGRQFETFLDVAKVELWKSWRDVTPPDQVLPVIRALESQLSLGRMESIGVSRNRALAERTLLLAPSYYRGAINLVGAIGERGVAGQIARQALVAYAAGGVATFMGLAYALGMDEATIVERLNPAHPKYHMWDVEVNDKRLHVGFGGIHRSLLRLLANMTTTSLEHPENWKSLTPAKNPLVRWYRGHAAAVPGLTWDAITGRDYLGQESDLTTVGQSVVPLAIQPVMRGGLDTSPVEVGASLTGLSAYPAK